MKVVKQRTGKIDYHKCDVFMILSSFPAAYLGHRCMLRACDLRLPGKPNANTHSAHAEIYCLHHCHVSFCQAMLNLMSMLIQNTNLNFVWLCTFICSFMCAFFFFFAKESNKSPICFEIHVQNTCWDWYFTRERSWTFILCECLHVSTSSIQQNLQHMIRCIFNDLEWWRIVR